MAVFANQAQISHRISQRSDFAVLIRVNRPNWDEHQPKSLARRQNDTLALELKPVTRSHENREQLFPRQPEAALAIRDRDFADPPNLPGHELIGPPANERHRS